MIMSGCLSIRAHTFVQELLEIENFLALIPVETGKPIIKFVILLHTRVLTSYLQWIIFIICQEVVA